MMPVVANKDDRRNELIWHWYGWRQVRNLLADANGEAHYPPMENDGGFVLSAS